jgi:hypothetical protein
MLRQSESLATWHHRIYNKWIAIWEGRTVYIDYGRVQREEKRRKTRHIYRELRYNFGYAGATPLEFIKRYYY